MEFLAIGAALGLIGGLAPGPYTALLVRTALEKGFRAGTKVALAPLATETVVMVLATLLLSYVPGAALRWIGVTAGGLMVLMALQTFRHAGRARASFDGTTKASGADLRDVALVGFLSPAPWLFWSVVAGPLLLSAWRQGLPEVVVFVLSFFSFFVGIRIVAAWAVVQGRVKLSGAWRVKAMRVLAVLLAVIGTVVVWQSLAGNFEAFVRQQEGIRRGVERVIG